jgi:hypothetical protein
MARAPEFAALAGAVERAGAAVRDGRLALDAAAIDALAAAVDACKLLVRALADWGPASRPARARTRRSRALLDAPPRRAAPPPSRRSSPSAPSRRRPRRAARLPEPTPPDTRTALPRGRRADRRDARAASSPRRARRRRRPDAGALDAARTTLGADLGAAMRDLRDLADSYAVQPVARFASVREAPLAALDARTLELVATAVAALLEVARRGRGADPRRRARRPAVGTPRAAAAPRRTARPATRPHRAGARRAARDRASPASGDLGALVERGAAERPGTARRDGGVAAGRAAAARGRTAAAWCRGAATVSWARGARAGARTCATGCAPPPALPDPALLASSTTCSTSAVTD